MRRLPEAMMDLVTITAITALIVAITGLLAEIRTWREAKRKSSRD